MSLPRRVQNFVIRITQSMNIRKKVIILYAFIVFIPTALLAVGAGYVVLYLVRENYLITIQEAVRQNAQSIAFKKQSYDLIVTRAATDGELISRLSREYNDIYEQLDTVLYVDRSFQYTDQYLPGIKSFRIYHSNSTLVQDGGFLWRPENRMISGEREEAWFERTIETPGALKWSNVVDNERELVVSHKISNHNGGYYGIIYMRLDYNEVFAEFLHRPFDGAGDLYIVDERGNIIASSSQEQIGIRLSESSIQPYWNDSFEMNAVMNGKLFVTSKLDSGWTVAALVHLDRMEEQSRLIFISVGAGIVFFLMLSIFLLYAFLNNFVWRIHKLGKRMNDISRGDFEVSVKNRVQDELGELELLFNHMTGRLGKLVEENAQVGIKEKEQSFKALQAQINPHFIYNSLGLLRWRALDLHDEKQIRIIDALTSFYRIALNNRENVTAIRDELEHVKAYLEIQQLRYPDRVSVDWDIDPEVMDLYTIKLLLQPIVENCYLHSGITQVIHAQIRISIIRLDGEVHFEIFDNGKGLRPEILELVRMEKYEGTRNGFGLNNIRERLRLYFGLQGHFAIDSIENEWTCISIRIPVCTNKPQIMRGEGYDSSVNRG